MYAERLEKCPTIFFRSCSPDDMLDAMRSTLQTTGDGASCAAAPVLLLTRVADANDGAAVNQPPRRPTQAGFSWLLAEAAVHTDPTEYGWSRA